MVIKTYGSRAEVFHGKAKKTSGGLTKKGLKKNKWGRIVSVRLSKLAKKQKRLVKAGYSAKKGKFGFVRTAKASKKVGKAKRPRTRKRRSKKK